MKKIRNVYVDIKCVVWLRTRVQTTLTNKQIKELARDTDEAMDFFNDGLGADGNWDLQEELGLQPLDILNEDGCFRASDNVKNPSSYVWIREVNTED